MIEVKGLTKKYNDFVAVSDVSFSIPKGEIVGLLGHNGAGKTTILKMLTGYLEPTEGSASIAGLDISEYRLSAQEKIGYLPENCPLYPEMTVVEYLEYIARLRSIPESSVTQAIRDVISKTELREKSSSLIQTLSKGFRQRVGLAQAMLHCPDILILDEPTSGLDPSQINHIRALVKELSENSTVILSTHILQEVEAVCDRVIILNRGKLALDSKIKDLQTSNRLLLSVDRGIDDVLKCLSGLDGISAVYPLSSKHEENSFRIELKEQKETVAPVIAKAVVASGHKLFSLSDEKLSLEAVFRDIHEQNSGGGDEN